MTELIKHLCAPVKGGVDDYINVLCGMGPGHQKLHLSPEAIDEPLHGLCVLHYVGYGYEKRGTPIWLLKKIRQDRSSIRKLVVWFHELYAFGAPWSSAFWLSPVQRYISRALMGLADVAVTNRQASKNWLIAGAGQKDCRVMPVFSNVGELDELPPKRERAALVFGGAPLREKTYRAMGGLLESLIHSGYVVHDVGPRIENGELVARLQQNGVVKHGALAANLIPELFARMDIGLIDYPTPFLAKSGVFAAYAAHGICPVVLGKNERSMDALLSGERFLTAQLFQETGDAERLSVGRASWEWYQAHQKSRHFAVLNEVLSA